MVGMNMNMKFIFYAFTNYNVVAEALCFLSVRVHPCIPACVDFECKYL